VSVYNSNHIAVFHRGRQVVYDGIPELFLTTDECLIRFFEDLNARTECRGSTGVGKEDFSKCMPKSRTAFFDNTLQTWRHLKCTGFVKTGLVCAACKKFRRVLQTCLRKKKLKKPLKIAVGSRYCYLQRRKMRLCQQQRNSLRVILATMKRKLRRQTENGLGSFLEKLPDNQKVSFEHAVRLAKSNREMRYDHKWILACILLCIKSPKAYEHLREHQLLALPCKSTFQRYVSVIKHRLVVLRLGLESNSSPAF
jgi:hypothetical protein